MTSAARRSAFSTARSTVFAALIPTVSARTTVAATLNAAISFTTSVVATAANAAINATRPAAAFPSAAPARPDAVHYVR